jgi:hypothetical protein
LGTKKARLLLLLLHTFGKLRSRKWQSWAFRVLGLNSLFAEPVGPILRPQFTFAWSEVVIWKDYSLKSENGNE